MPSLNPIIKNNAKQVYCTIAEQNLQALQLLKKQGLIVVGRSESQYKVGITEVMLYKLFSTEDYDW